MKDLGKSILYGALLWAVVFVSSVFIFPLKTSNPPFFETLITILLCFFTVAVSILYFRKTSVSVNNAAITGITWLIVNIIIDLPLFSFGPMKRPFADYMTDIGLTYLIIPIITIGIALVSKTSKQT